MELKYSYPSGKCAVIINGVLYEGNPLEYFAAGCAKILSYKEQIVQFSRELVFKVDDSCNIKLCKLIYNNSKLSYGFEYSFPKIDYKCFINHQGVHFYKLDGLTYNYIRTIFYATHRRGATDRYYLYQNNNNNLVCYDPVLDKYHTSNNIDVSFSNILYNNVLAVPKPGITTFLSLPEYKVLSYNIQNSENRIICVKNHNLSAILFSHNVTGVLKYYSYGDNLIEIPEPLTSSSFIIPYSERALTFFCNELLQLSIPICIINSIILPYLKF